MRLCVCRLCRILLWGCLIVLLVCVMVVLMCVSCWLLGSSVVKWSWLISCCCWLIWRV